jgi:hypothetical protein
LEYLTIEKIYKEGYICLTDAVDILIQLMVMAEAMVMGMAEQE